MLAELSYAAAVRALDLQERSVEQLRARTGTLLAAGYLTASFLGAQAIRSRHGLGTLGVLALVSLAVGVLVCLYILLPKRGFVFSVSGPRIYESLYEYASDRDEVLRRLAYWLEGFWTNNQSQIDRLARCFPVAAVALTLQLLFWAIGLTTAR